MSIYLSKTVSIYLSAIAPGAAKRNSRRGTDRKSSAHAGHARLRPLPVFMPDLFGLRHVGAVRKETGSMLFVPEELQHHRPDHESDLSGFRRERRKTQAVPQIKTIGQNGRRDRFESTRLRLHGRNYPSNPSPRGNRRRFKRAALRTRRPTRRTHRQAGRKSRSAFGQAGGARGDVGIRKALNNIQISRKA